MLSRFGTKSVTLMKWLKVSAVSASILMGASLVTPAFAFHFPWDQSHDTTEPEPPEDPGPCEGEECENDPCNGASQGSPVYLATGHFIWSETDISLKGRPALTVERTFNSHDPRVGMLGAGWSLACDAGLIFTVRYGNESGESTETEQFIRRFSNGKRYVYAKQEDGTFIAPGVFDVVSRQEDKTARLDRRNGSYSLYGETGQLLSKVDQNGNAINYSYDEQGRLIQKADENGRALHYEYNSIGLIAVIRDHTDREWLYDYDQDANLVSVTNPLQGARQYQYKQYTPQGDGNTYSQLTRVTDETDVIETEVSYSGSRVLSYKEYENTFNYQYDTSNRKVTKTDSQNSVWVFTYNETGQFTRIEGPLQRTTVYERDEESLLTRMVDPLGTEMTYTYDAFGRELTSSDLRGTFSTEYVPDTDWPAKTTSRSGRIVSITYDGKGNPLVVTDPAMHASTLAWSQQGDLLSITNALTNKTELSYTAQGMNSEMTDPLGRVTQYQYDSLNNLTQVVNPEGETSSYTYDVLDRLITHTDGNGDSTTYSYDAVGRIAQVTAANNQSVLYAYDAFGRLSERTFYDGTKREYQYRNDNLIAQITRPDNVVVSMTYDTAKRLMQRTVGSEDTYVYAYNLRDELTSISNGTGVVSITYDAFGRKTSETVNGQLTAYQYTIEDEVTHITGQGVEQVQQFDVRGLLKNIAVAGEDIQYAYDPRARLTSIARGASGTSVMQYNNADLLTGINHGSNERSHQYVYDLADRVSQWQGVAGEARDYDYDNTGRLTNAQSPSLPEAFNYDSIGNRQNDNAQFDVASRITQDDNFSYSYDINGNRTQKLNKSTGELERYTYNAQDQLVRYQHLPDNQPGSVPSRDVRYSYGPLGRRWSKVDNLSAASVNFFWSGSQLVGEIAGANTRRYILEGMTPIGFVEDGNVFHYLRDHLGAAHEVVASDGSLVWQGDFRSFGSVLPITEIVENNLRFPGQYFDVESGLHYNYFRDYDPSLGRYIQSDPIGLAGGINTYAYAGGNPLSSIDPLGLYPVGLCGPMDTTITCGAKKAAYDGNMELLQEMLGYGGVPNAKKLIKQCKKVSKKNGKNPDRNSTPGTNTAQNKAFDDATKGLTDEQKRRIHEEITKKGLDYHDLKDLADSMKDGTF